VSHGNAGLAQFFYETDAFQFRLKAELHEANLRVENFAYDALLHDFAFNQLFIYGDGDADGGQFFLWSSFLPSVS